MSNNNDSSGGSDGGNDPKPHVVIGMEVTGLINTGAASPAAQDVYASLQAARQDGYDFVTTMIPDINDTSAIRDDVTSLESKWWTTSVVGIVPDIQSVASCLEWGQHMDLPAVIFPSLPSASDEVCEYAASLCRCLSSVGGQQLWIPVELHSANLFQNWFLFHKLIEYHSAVSILLILKPSPPAPIEAVNAFVSETLDRFHILLGSAAPVSAAGFSTSIFLTNKKGYPTLPKAQQTMLSYIYRRTGSKLRLLLLPSDPSAPVPNIPLPMDAQGATRTLPHIQYLRHFRSTRAEIVADLDSQSARQEEDYCDALQKPLQPLADHLQFQIYETFELDPVKYKQYERAILQAMQEFQVSAISSKIFSIVVAGAGRGPLVTACLDAHSTLKVSLPIRIFAVEKNPSAVVYLQAKLRNEWNSKGLVTVVKSDLRDLCAAQLFGAACTDKVDLVVSELLGSFGCNELSPECLDTLFATDICGPQTVSIPTRYTAFAAPVASIRLYQKVVEQALFPDPERGPLYNNGFTKSMETPYVVRPKAASQIGAPQPCWTFAHPSANAEYQPPAYRHVSLTFPTTTTSRAWGCGYGPLSTDQPTTATTLDTPLPWTCTGILGTFSADLYDCAEHGHFLLSTNPATFSEGMFSWFPLYFPLVQPLVVPAAATVRTHIWRRVSRSRVWYEWSVQVLNGTTVVAASPIHNPGGRSYSVSLNS